MASSWYYDTLALPSLSMSFSPFSDDETLPVTPPSIAARDVRRVVDQRATARCGLGLERGPDVIGAHLFDTHDLYNLDATTVHSSRTEYNLPGSNYALVKGVWNAPPYEIRRKVSAPRQTPTNHVAHFVASLMFTIMTGASSAAPFISTPVCTEVTDIIYATIHAFTTVQLLSTNGIIYFLVYLLRISPQATVEPDILTLTRTFALFLVLALKQSDETPSKDVWAQIRTAMDVPDLWALEGMSLECVGYAMGIERGDWQDTIWDLKGQLGRMGLAWETTMEVGSWLDDNLLHTPPRIPMKRSSVTRDHDKAALLGMALEEGCGVWRAERRIVIQDVNQDLSEGVIARNVEEWRRKTAESYCASVDSAVSPRWGIPIPSSYDRSATKELFPDDDEIVIPVRRSAWAWA